MKYSTEHSEEQSNRREVIKKVGKFVIPIIVTFQLTTLHVRASGSLDSPPGAPVQLW